MPVNSVFRRLFLILFLLQSFLDAANIKLSLYNKTIMDAMSNGTAAKMSSEEAMKAFAVSGKLAAIDQRYCESFCNSYFPFPCFYLRFI